MTAQKKEQIVHKTLSIIGIILCVILIPILILNCTLIVKSFVSDDVPSIGGTMPLIVLSPSMHPIIQEGDLIFCKTADPKDIKEDDIIAFFDPTSKNNSITTHKVIEVTEFEGKIAWRTKGENNPTPDKLLITEDKLVGIYTDVRLPAVGNVAIFMQTVPGFIVCVVLPILLFIGYDIIRRKLYERSSQTDTEALMKELEELRRLKAEKEQQAQETPPEVDAPQAVATEADAPQDAPDAESVENTQDT